MSSPHPGEPGNLFAMLSYLHKAEMISDEAALAWCFVLVDPGSTWRWHWQKPMVTFALEPLNGMGSLGALLAAFIVDQMRLAGLRADGLEAQLIEHDRVAGVIRADGPLYVRDNRGHVLKVEIRSIGVEHKHDVGARSVSITGMAWDVDNLDPVWPPENAAAVELRGQPRPDDADRLKYTARVPGPESKAIK